MQNNNKWLALINIPIQMGVIIFAFNYLGNWLDENHANSKIYYQKVFVLIGVFVALYNVYRQVKNIGNTK
jgi:F0F1-type ATP synthase assembly protein I